MSAWRCLLATIAAGLALGVFAGPASGQPTAPTLASTCGTAADSTTALASLLNGASGSVTLPRNACFNVNGIVQVHNTSNLFIHGNGATFRQTRVGSASAPIHPILFLTQDTNLTIRGLTIDGAYNGTNGGDYYEGNYGVEMEADSGVNLSVLTVENIQGDFMILQAPNDVTGTEALNTNVSVTDSTFMNAGYHGLTVEAANGFTFANNTVTNVGLDAMDFEVDSASTLFSASGQPEYDAEDNVIISDNTWNNFGGDWFASLQGQWPGVQEHNITLIGNTINSPNATVDVVGTNPAVTSGPYFNVWIVISHNVVTQSASNAYAEPGPINTANVAGVTVMDNTWPVAGVYAAKVTSAYGLLVEGNQLSGAAGVLNPATANNFGWTPCGNHYGVNTSKLDSTCQENNG